MLRSHAALGPTLFDSTINHAAMIPARDVGGDFYDFFLLGPSQLGVVIADVSGKGIPAAIFMAVSRTLMKATALTASSPAACLQQVNRLLNAENSAEMFVSVFYGILDTQSGRLVFSNGGHNPPLFVRAGGDAQFLDAKPGCVLGVLDEAVYEDATRALMPGDTLVLYTDGVTEAMNGVDELYGEERLQRLLRNPADSPRNLIDRVIADVKQHSGEATQSDDITLLAVTYRGSHGA